MRVLQITHVLSQPDIAFHGVETLRALEAVLDRAFSQGKKPDLIIATGDLADDGAAASYRRLRDVRFGSKADSFGHCHVNCILEQI